MNTSNSLGKALLALQLAAASPLASAAILQNGSFELPVVANGAVVQTTPVGWAWDGPIGFLFSSDAPGFAADGEQFVDIGNTSAFALRQDFSIAAAGLYRLSWADNAAAARIKSKAAEQQRINAGVEHAASMIRFHGGQWRVVLTLSPILGDAY